ncbi:MAG: DUF1800 domain-containing protein [Candidatus Hydrogenedentes bacterium]|nr:DUF1800 domain-containing protein [Candidatus Hydrogenedentota bacterium]
MGKDTRTKAVLSPIMPSEWDERLARHLLNRAGFGVPRDRVAHLARVGPTAAVDELVDFEDFPSDPDLPDFIPGAEVYLERRRDFESLSQEERRKARQEFAVRERGQVRRLQTWWFERMTTTARPLEEKMTLFWHGHFATSAQKIKSARQNLDLNRLFREHAAGNFKALTIAVGQSPAMLRYLDNVQNVKGKPNENWARELMELFTLGQGNYTEDDIKESARAFTGWTLVQGRFALRERAHDFGEKTFMGRTGHFDGWDILDVIFEQPEAATFICRKLFEFFAYQDPEPEIVEALASSLRFHNYEIKPVLRQLFRSKAFYSSKAVGTQIKSPVQFMVQLVRDLHLEEPPYSAMARASAQLGQNLFFPPNVAGWEGGRAWINANTLLARYNIPRTLVVAHMVEPDEMSMMDMRGMERSRRQAYRDQFQDFLKRQPPDRRRAFRDQMETAKTPEDRIGIIEQALFESSTSAHWDLRAAFTDLDFSTARECVDALSQRFLSRTLSKRQKAVLASALGGERDLGSPLTVEKLTRDRMSSALQLLFSMAEYQLC